MNKRVRLEILSKEMAHRKLPLKRTATKLVFGKGDPNARVFFIGEAPGKNEDLTGEPFVGLAGRHLDTLLNSIGLPREKVYITSILKYRPPNNRPPVREEIRTHTPFLVQQIQIIEPQFIVPMGNFATKFVLAEFDVEKMAGIPGIMRLHGKTKNIKFHEHTFTIFPSYHPAASLYNFGLKRIMLKDFRKLKTILNGQKGKKR
jgi:DNA polymerase